MKDDSPMGVPSFPIDGADRAVSPVIGAVLVFALLITVLATFQLAAVPQFVAEEEFQHNERVHGEMSELAGAMSRTASTASGESVAVRTGVRYQQRAILINPPPAAGTLRTTEQREITVENAAAEGETGDYWDGSTKTFDTRAFVYEPSYNEYDNAPRTVIETGTAFNRFGGGETVPLGGGGVLDGHRIAITSLTGAFDRSQTGTTTVDIRPHSAPARSVTVTAADDPITLSIPTTLPVEAWETLLSDQRVENGGNVADIAADPEDDAVRITLREEDEDGPIAYDLRLAQVGVESGGSPDATYVTDIAGNGAIIESGEQIRITAEVRDRFDNPVSGTSVEASTGQPQDEVIPDQRRSGDDGRVSFIYNPGQFTGIGDDAATVTLTVQPDDGTDERTVTFEIQVRDR
ncbi:MAG: hypothetical protein PPP58_02285 [Natronomonas sp.]